MYLRNVELTNFRSYRSLELSLEPGLTVLHGDNGTGKSNLLEASYLLAIGKSYHASTERELVSWEAAEAGGYCIIAGTVARADGDVDLRVGLDCAGQSNTAQKRIRVNGVPKRASDMVGALSAVLFTADDIDLIFGSPQGRRRYLDIMLSQLGGQYVHALQRYQRVLTQRNALLRSVRDGRASDSELVFWDESLCREGALVLGARFDAMQRLVRLVSDAFTRLEATDQLDVSYTATVDFEERPTAEALAVALERNRGAERNAGMTLVGPHRDDLKIVMNGVEMSKHASRGQARLAALSLRVAEGELLEERRGDAPVILFDDVLSELDVRRRTLVLEEASQYTQSIITTTDVDFVPAAYLSGAHRMRIEAGQILAEAVA